MFHANRWAGVFVTVLGENAETGLACLKAIAPPLKGISSALFGYSGSRQLEKILRESAQKAIHSAGAMETAGEYAIRFITLLVEKNLFQHIDAIMLKIEALIDEKNRVLIVTVESTASMDAMLEEELRQGIARRTGAARIKMKTTLNPDLLGGYRLRIGGFYIDASLKGQIEKMKAALDAAGGGI